MGRARKTNYHLPEKVYQDKKSHMFYFVDADNKYHQLGRELGPAMSNYYDLMPHHKRVISMADLIDKYMIENSPLKAPQTHRGEKKCARQLRHRLGEIFAEDITTADVAEYYRLRSNESIVCANREMCLLSVIFQAAIGWGISIENHTRLIQKRGEAEAKNKKKVERYITDEQVEIFQAYSPKWLKAYVDIKLITGLRQCAMLELTKAMVHDKFLFIPNIGKNGGATRYKWTSELRAAINLALEASPPESKFLFTTTKGTAHGESSFKSAWSRAMEKAVKNGLSQPFAERYLRNKAVTDCEDLATASKIVGHTSTSVTKQHYSMLGTTVNPFTRKA